MGNQQGKQTTAREWLVLIALGLVVVIAGFSAGRADFAGLGAVLALIGAGGIAWRLLENR